MNHSTGLAAWLRLTLTPGVGGESQRKLLAAFGLPDAIFAASRSELAAVVGKRAELLFEQNVDDAIEQTLAWLALPGNHFITLTEGLENLPALGKLVLWKGAQDFAIEAV